MRTRHHAWLSLLAVPAMALSTALQANPGQGVGAGPGPGKDRGGPPVLNVPPAGLIGDIRQQYYDGDSDDLLTAGLGQGGLAGDAPGFADPGNPTATELRRLAIFNNYTALVPVAAGGGYGEFFGPAVGSDTVDGKIAGHEWIAFMRSGEDNRHTVMVQVPDSFDSRRPCMVTAPSSGSRGVYGAIGTGGEWGLKQGCVVVYTDKGTGMGVHNLERGTVTAIDGTLVEAGSESAVFSAPIAAADLESFNADNPKRIAFKHAHSRANPESEWGQNVLDSIRFGFFVVNELYGQQDALGRRIPTIRPGNTVVIASGVSNGGGAAVLALEQDTGRLIDGLAASEPNVNPTVRRDFTIRQGDGPVLVEHSRSLLDYQTALAVYQGCANAAPSIAAAPFNLVTDARGDIAANACARLADLGLVTGDDTDERAESALAVLAGEFGFQPEQNLVQPVTWWANVSTGIAVTYANAYGRFGVEDKLCDITFAATDAGAGGAVTPLPDAAERAIFSIGNGIPPTGGVNLVNENADQGVPTEIGLARSPNTGNADYSLDAFLCLRGLVDGDTDGASRVAEGIDEIRATGDLQGRPAIFVTPRGDQILPVNHTSRPYVGLNRLVEGKPTRLRYYEVLNAQHLDILNNFPGLDARFIPLHYYYFQALDNLYEHLRGGTPLAPSQVVRAQPRGEGAPALSAENLPDISNSPDAADLILFEDSQLRIPD